MVAIAPSLSSRKWGNYMVGEQFFKQEGNTKPWGQEANTKPWGQKNEDIEEMPYSVVRVGLPLLRIILCAGLR